MQCGMHDGTLAASFQMCSCCCFHNREQKPTADGKNLKGTKKKKTPQRSGVLFGMLHRFTIHTSFSLENRSASATQTSWSNEKRSHNGTCSYTPEIHHCYQNCAVRNLMIQVRVQHCCGINLVNMQPVIRWITEYKGHLLIIISIIKVSHCNMQMITKK